jgi:hypothetical protein
MTLRAPTYLDPAAGEVSDLEATACRFHERQLEDKSHRIAALIHEDAEMVLLSNRLQPLRGRQRIMAALARGREAEIYHAEVERCELLDDDVLLVIGQARYALADNGIGVSRVWWLDEFRDGLLWRVEAFRTEAAARQANAFRRPSLRA